MTFSALMNQQQQQQTETQMPLRDYMHTASAMDVRASVSLAEDTKPSTIALLQQKFQELERQKSKRWVKQLRLANSSPGVSASSPTQHYALTSPRLSHSEFASNFHRTLMPHQQSCGWEHEAALLSGLAAVFCSSSRTVEAFAGSNAGLYSDPSSWADKAFAKELISSPKHHRATAINEKRSSCSPHMLDIEVESYDSHRLLDADLRLSHTARVSKGSLFLKGPADSLAFDTDIDTSLHL